MIVVVVVVVDVVICLHIALMALGGRLYMDLCMAYTYPV